ncbi:MAG: hypothetical protein JST48_15090 [Bacteroidetes bacterium]|nr:hypothetical protein [Bacteroidota bacterium]
MEQNTHTLTPEKKIAIGIDALASIDPDMLDDAYVYVHCKLSITLPGLLIRIWKTTVLQDYHSASRAQLIHAENISYAPQWTLVPDRGTYSFLLIFSALPKDCSMFDLVEDIPQPGGFLIKNIARNKSDVYRITLGD